MSDVTYECDELLGLCNYGVFPTLSVRNVIFGHRLWLLGRLLVLHVSCPMEFPTVAVFSAA